MCISSFSTLTAQNFNSGVPDTGSTRGLVKKYDCKVKNSCIGCGVCIDACMMNSIVLDDLKAHIDPNWCCGCLICGEMCPTNSIKIMEVEGDGDNRND